MTVCEVGANIGRVWRELSEVDKQRFNEEFLNDKVSLNSKRFACHPTLILVIKNGCNSGHVPVVHRY